MARMNLENVLLNAFGSQYFKLWFSIQKWYAIANKYPKTEVQIKDNHFDGFNTFL